MELIRMFLEVYGVLPDMSHDVWIMCFMFRLSLPLRKASLS